MAANSSDQQPNSQQPKTAVAGVSTKIKSWINKKTKGVASLESQSNQLISPDGTQINIDSLPDTVSVLITESTPGHTTFDQAIGTQTSAKGHHFIAFSNLEEGSWAVSLHHPQVEKELRNQNTQKTGITSLY